MVLLLVIGLGWAVRKLFGPEATRNLWLRVKWLFAYLYLTLLKHLLKPVFPFDFKSRDLDKSGVTSLPEAWRRENPRTLLDAKQAVDSIDIWGADQSGHVLMVRVARRHGRIAELWIYLRLASGEEYQSPALPDLRICNTDGKSFSVKGLKFEVLEPLRRWRIGFNGLLRKGVKNQWDSSDDDHCVPVQFNFIWHPMYSYSVYPSNFNSKLTATRLAKHPWNKDFIFNRKLSSLKSHEQWGQMHGTLTVEERPLTLLLTGTKTREFGVLDCKTINKRLVVRGIDTIGTAIDLFAETDANGQLNVYHGYVAPPSNKELYYVSKCDIGKADDAYFDGHGKEVNVNLIADGRNFNVKLNTEGSGFKFFAGEDWDCQGYCRFIQLEINGRQGFGLVETYRKYDQGSPVPSSQSVSHLTEPDFATNDLIVTFLDKACMNSKLVGGKGASLALMTKLGREDDRFSVPPGFCLTKTCFEDHLKENLSLELAIYHLEDVAWKRKDGDINSESSRLTNLICNSTLTDTFRDKLKFSLRKAFGEDFDDKKMAVRSSAIGEDGEEMSAAGQNETFLGVRGFDKVCEAVIKCWASQFSFRSVEYKRQNGQLLNGGMAVVIQEMIPAEVAGVLFSRDPLDGSQRNMVISANYGLGESIVSATADPDTIFLNRSWSDDLSIGQVTVGKKATKYVMSDDGGTVESNIETLDSSRCSLSDINALKLGRIAVELEKHFGNSRDIEWALRGDNIYLLQARPITSGSVMTDFEVLHEFDVAMRTIREKFTTANVAEVMAGALSPLYITSCFRIVMQRFERVMLLKTKNFRNDPTILSAMPLYTNHALMDYTWAHAAYINSKEKGMMEKVADVGMFGRIMDSEETVKMARERYEKVSWSDMMVMMGLLTRGLLKAEKLVKSSEEKCRNFPTPGAGISTPFEAFQEIKKSLDDMCMVFVNHMTATTGSVVWNGITLALLANGNKEISLDVYSDFASLIGKNNGAESGDVPSKLQEIVTTILEEDVDKKFSGFSPQEAFQWMNTKLTRTSSKFQEFLQRHGHRGQQEFDVKSITWGMEPTKVVKVLQAMLQNPPKPGTINKGPTLDETINTLKSPLTPLKRKFLKWVAKRCINGVCYRERAKSMLVKITHSFRLAFRHLANLMVKDGFIPDEDLLFFMTFEEVGQLILTRSARIIMRARRRQRLYPHMDSIVYPEMITGLPEPINESEDDLSFAEGVSQVKGFPVCQGRVKGTARVVLTLDQADTLKRNDILITHATDIGWSPYFPMLGGVVTEIGGLISHGAVVAREYGLPCVIDAANATKIFKSGDEILLDANKGIVAKLSGDFEENGESVNL